MGDNDTKTHSQERSKVKLPPCSNPQQKVSCCQPLISGGALLTLHLLPSAHSLSPFLRGRETESTLCTGGKPPKQYGAR